MFLLSGMEIYDMLYREMQKEINRKEEQNDQIQ